MNAYFDCDFTVYVIDDELITRKTISAMIRAMDLEVLEYESAEAFLAAYNGKPGVVVCDWRMPGMTGLDLQVYLANQDVLLPVVIATSFPSTRFIVKAIKNGATTVLGKPFTQEELWSSLHEAIADYRKGVEQHTAFVNAKTRMVTFTESEKAVLQLLLQGKKNKEIAALLDVSLRTIDSRRKTLLTKMEVDNMAELIRLVVMVEVKTTASNTGRCETYDNDAINRIASTRNAQCVERI